MNRPGVLYRLTFSNGKVYIGITRETLSQRVRRHIRYARAGRHFALSAAIRKYGEDGFTAEVVATADDWAALQQAEIDAIKQHRAVGCYNMTGGGDGSLGVPLADATRQKISASLTGRRLTEEHRRRVSAAQIGKTIPAETRERMRQSALGSSRSPEQRQKVSAALKGRKRPPELMARIAATRKANRLSGSASVTPSPTPLC